jgi:2,3,4,5-tetrahydropyridine-2-carboxylate N-succinyltransferase
MTNPLKSIIEKAWEESVLPDPAQQKAIHETLALLDRGQIRVSEKIQGVWQTHEWIKKAILLYFRITQTRLIEQPLTPYYDKIPLKCADWQETDFQQAGFRVVPGAIIRQGAYIAPRCVLMPSFVNIGAHVAEGTMIDTWATVGSCAQIGKNCHISGGTGIGGVLEPLNATPVIIEDNCFIGARSEIAEGVIVEEGAVIAMGVFIGQSTQIIDRQTGEIFKGRVPAYAVVVPGTRPTESGPALACAVIVKRADAQTRAKVSINELLRDG